MALAHGKRSQGEWAIRISALSVASMVLCWVFLYFAQGMFWPMVTFTAALGGGEAVGLLIYLVIYLVNLFDKDRDKTRRFLGAISILAAMIITATMGFLALFAYL